MSDFMMLGYPNIFITTCLLGSGIEEQPTLGVCLSAACLPVCLSVCLSVCLFVCQGAVFECFTNCVCKSQLMYSSAGYRTYGVPTVRTDLPAPHIRRIDDSANYGDESNAYGLVNPAIFSTHGVHEKDLLLPRERHEVGCIY